MPSATAAQTPTQNTNPAKPWSPSPELQALIAPLIEAQLSVVIDRTFGLRKLQEFTADAAALPEDQVRSCAKIKFLTFLRINKKLRTDPLNAEFIEAGRAFNRELLQARTTAGLRLREIATNPEISSEVRRLAACVHARTAYMRVEYAELYEGELPAHLLPPKNTESNWDAAEWMPPDPAAFNPTHINPAPFNPASSNWNPSNPAPFTGHAAAVVGPYYTAATSARTLQINPPGAPQTTAQRQAAATPIAPVITAADPATAAVNLLASRASDHHTSLTAAAAFNPFAPPIPKPCEIPTGTEAANQRFDLTLVRPGQPRTPFQ